MNDIEEGRWRWLFIADGWNIWHLATDDTSAFCGRTKTDVPTESKPIGVFQPMSKKRCRNCVDLAGQWLGLV